MKFKGHTKIELKDVNTGQVTCYEDDNMLTNAISKMISFASQHNYTQTLSINNNSHWYNLLGGLVLFDTALTENADTLYPPAGVTPIGYGQVGNTTNYEGCTRWGVYSTTDSDTSSSDTEKKFVWDFGRNSGNGTIASVCLTHRNAGLFGFGMDNWYNTQSGNNGEIATGWIIPDCSKGRQAQNTSNYGVVGTSTSSSNGSYVDYCVDSANDRMYSFKVCNDGVSVIYHSMSPEKFDVFRYSRDWQSYTETTYSETFTGTYFWNFYNTDEKTLYFWTGTSESGYGGSSVDVYIHKLDLSGTPTLTKNWNRLQVSGYSSISNMFMCTSSAIYFIDVWTKKLYKKSISTGTVSEITTLDSSYNLNGYLDGNKSFILNGLIYIMSVMPIQYSSNTVFYNVIIDTSDDSVRYTNVDGRGRISASSGYPHAHIPPISKDQIIFGTMNDYGATLYKTLSLQEYEYGSGSSTCNVTSPVMYLGTINNLSTAVVKDSTKTMTITYTITAVEE